MITPVDIENKVFKKVKLGGYDINEVENFLEELIIDYENMYKQNAELKEKLSKAEENEKYYSSLEVGATKTVENSQKAADEIKNVALIEAERIKSEAAAEAEKIKAGARNEESVKLEDLKLDIKSKEIELETIKKEMQIYKIKMTSMFEAGIKILNEE